MKQRTLKILAVILSVVLLLECLYCVAIFTDWVPALTKLRKLYIETAMSTMHHQWLATALIPADVVQAVVEDMEDSRTAQVGLNSQGWTGTEPTKTPPKDPETAFFDQFPELDQASVREWAESHPEALSDGWDGFYVNEAGLDDRGTSMITTQGDQVLAIDAANGLLVIRITGDSYRGVLVLGKDPSRLCCAAAEQWGYRGQTVGEIAQANEGLVALTGSGFGDANGVGDGAEQSGFAICGGEHLGTYLTEGYKRIELRSDNRLYITDAYLAPHPDCTDATEWTPALIVDGEVIMDQYYYVAMNPRACLGQASDGTVMMLCIEGRYLDSLGCNAQECAKILARYDGYQAMNLDGGTSAILWYQGEPITRCSNPQLPEGRLLPNAWLYCAEPIE